MDALRDMSVVTATYKLGDRPMGSLGVIGPTRMDYGRVVRLLNFISRALGRGHVRHALGRNDGQGRE